jgi:penicillin-binding protein 1C
VTGRFHIKYWPIAGAAAAIIMVVALDLLLPPPLERARDVSPLVIDQHDQWLHAFATQDGRWRFAADLDEIDPVFIERLVMVEDKRFWRHGGVDPTAILRAGISAVKAGRIVSGASTITMQTARLLEPRPRTLGSKAIEMLRALQIERRLSKKEILELYLTLTPYGGNIEGVRAASLLYFDKEPVRLTDAEQALLIALPQAPEARRPDRRTAAADSARGEVLEKFAVMGVLTPERVSEARETPLPSSRKPFVNAAYHTAYRLAREHAPGIVQSTIDASLQMRAEKLLQAYVEQFDDDATAALLVVENDTRAVRAAVGSSGLDTDGGWIDLTAATRSPGSTLKPFIYALAFQDGLAGPDTVIDDMPRTFGDYTPENFDRVFRGEVTVREALQHSLNLPAVTMLDRIGAPRFSALMKAAGVVLKTPVRADKKPGLALALGGAGVTAQDIATLYAALGTNGAVKPLIWTEDKIGGNAQSYGLFSEDTAARVSAILADAPSLSGRAPAMLSKSATRVAFKTGTSYGYRDAWAAGHGGGYTVVVWVGFANGAPRPGQTGRKAAAPLLFDVFDMLDQDAEASGANTEKEYEQPALALARFNGRADRSPPEIIFPRNGVEVYITGAARGFSFAARGGGAGYQWYVDGEPLDHDATSGRFIWRPSQPGFYDVTVVDMEGRAAKSKVRVLASG